jgi:RNA polymerase sigma factor (sigma-70 family)
VNPYISALNTDTQRQQPNSVDDGMLVAVALSGDSSAFVELSQRHSKHVLHTIYRITNNWQDAEDVLQESLMRAFVHLHTYECRASFSTWLTRIAINTALMLLRKKKGAPRSTIDGALYDIAQSEMLELRDHRDNPEQHYARQQRASILSGAILRLRPESRRILELQQAGELTTREIAESLGISEPAVKSRLLRAKLALKEFVQDESPRTPTAHVSRARALCTPSPCHLSRSLRDQDLDISLERVSES